ncbi:MAG: OmpA family protein [Pseudomonadota bacterium]
MRHIMNGAIAAAATLLSSCTLNTVLTEPFLNREIEGEDFNAHLAREYQRRAAVEATVDVEWTHAARFADKGREAANGELVLPWIAGDWNLQPEDQTELMLARARLMDALNLGGRERNPLACAKAQTYYDGWLEQAHDNDIGPGAYGATQSANARAEKAAFIKIMPECEDCVGVTADSLATDFLVYFEFDRAVLTPEAEGILDAVAEHLRCAGAGLDLTIAAVGHTDLSGPDGYNVRLSKDRAGIVVDGLTKRGVKVDIVDWNGESAPAKPTPNGVREPLNRRVEIMISAPDEITGFTGSWEESGL